MLTRSHWTSPVTLATDAAPKNDERRTGSLWDQARVLLMKRLGLLRGFIAAAMAIAFLSMIAGGASAADNTASITVHLRQCNGAPATDYFTDCHDNGVAGVTI